MFIKNWLKNKSIQNKLIYSNHFGIVFAIVPIVTIMMTYEFFALRSSILEEIRVQADIVGESSAAAMAFRDGAAASETLSSLHGAHDMIEAHLVLPDGTILKSYYRKKNGKAVHLQTLKPLNVSKIILSLNRVIINKPIYLRSELVGSLILVSSLNGFYTRMMWYSLIIVIAVAIGFLLARHVASLISRTITEPLSSLTVATQKIITDQDYTTTFSTDAEDEVGKLSYAFSEMMMQIYKRDKTMKQLAYYDRVSGIANRHFFEERIIQTVENAERYGTLCYLLMIDLDDFKIVNDKLGHHIGDLLLRHVSESLTHTMRQNDSIFRIGGDEFAIIIESTSYNEAVDQIAKKIIQAISTPVVLEGHEVKVGASIGISCFPRLSTDVRSLMTTADSAMYIAKKQGKNSYQIYGQEQ